MLGIGGKKEFQVSACGKHPAFDDYFSVNVDSPMGNALRVWVENGMAVGGKRDPSRIPYSFRFWVRGIKKKEVILGILRDSSDRMGRIYPLMMMGRLFMDERDRQWHHIFSLFENIFREFEGMTAAHYQGFRELENGLCTLAGRSLPPAGGPGDPDPFSGCIKAWFDRDRQKREVLTLPVNTMKLEFSDFGPAKESRGFFGPKPVSPGAVFLGGRPENPVVSIYSRALNTRDFLTLFDLTGEDIGQSG